MLNGLIFLYTLLFSNFGIAIIVFTVLVRILMLPLTLQQLHASKAMMALQPKIQELQRRYGKDKERLSRETMKLYKEQGVNPAGCLFPTLVQFPIWIGLYQSIIQALGATPENLLGLSQHLYPGLPQVRQAIPLASHFLGLDLAQPDPTRLVLPVLVGASMWVQQKMTTLPTADPRQAETNRFMLTMMPLTFGIFTMGFPSGLALYWVVSNLISIGIQYFVTGWGSLTELSNLLPIRGMLQKTALPTKKEPRITDPSPINPEGGSEKPTPRRKRSSDGRGGSKRKERR